MKKSYSGNLKPFAAVLMSGSDREKILPVLEELSSAGKELCYGSNSTKKSVLKRSSAVLAFFTENSVKDTDIQNAVLFAKSAGVPVIPILESEQTRLADALQPFFGANNAVFQSRYDAKGLADRLLSADSLKMGSVTDIQKKKFKATVGLLIAAAVLVLAGAGYLIYKSVTPPVPSSTPEPVPTPAVTLNATKEQEEAAKNAGLTIEELQKIQSLTLVSGHRLPAGESTDRVAHDEWDEEEKARYYVWNNEDYGQPGERLTLSEEVDLSFLPLCKNLRKLSLLYENFSELPDLSGLSKLTDVAILHCPLKSVECFSNSSSLKNLELTYTDVADLSPIASCFNLTILKYNDRFDSPVLESLGTAVPENLHNLTLADCRNLKDLSVLDSISGLFSANLQLDKSVDLSFLGKQKGLVNLGIDIWSGQAVDLSPLENIDSLQQIWIHGDRFKNLDFLKKQKGLTLFEYNANSGFDFTPLLKDLPALREIRIECEGRIPDLEFLTNVKSGTIFELRTRQAPDFSALENVTGQFVNMTLDIWDDFDFNDLAPYIENLNVSNLNLGCVRNLDCSRLPQLIYLNVWAAEDLENLEGLENQERLASFGIHDCRNFKSLAGLEGCKNVHNINLQNLPQLEDVEALYSLKISDFRWGNMLELLPGFSKMSFTNVVHLNLYNVPLLENLDFLDAMPPKTYFQELELNRLDNVTDLTPVLSRSGNWLCFPSQLGEQMEKAQENGLLKFENWQPGEPCRTDDGPSVTVESFEELENLSPLKKLFVRRLRILGGTFLKEDEWAATYWERGKAIPYVDHSTNEPYPAGNGTITDLSVFQGLTGLEELELQFQPLTSLDGIQNFENLRSVSFAYCEKITDISPLFTLNNMQDINVWGVPITSIEGVQNLSHLHRLDINDTKVTDLSPLKEVDYSECCERYGGFQLSIDGLRGIEDYSPLSAVPVYTNLNISIYDKKDAEKSNWLESVKDAEIHWLEARNWTFLDDEQLKTFAEEHPELNYIGLSWNETLTDLTPLLSLENLSRVRVSGNMKKALASLEGKDYTFELQIEE